MGVSVGPETVSPFRTFKMDPLIFFFWQRTWLWPTRQRPYNAFTISFLIDWLVVCWECTPLEMIIFVQQELSSGFGEEWMCRIISHRISVLSLCSMCVCVCVKRKGTNEASPALCICAVIPNHIHEHGWMKRWKVPAALFYPEHTRDCSQTVSKQHKVLKPLLSGAQRLASRGNFECACTSLINPSPLSAVCLSKVYSTVRRAGQRKDSILLSLLTHGKRAALPQALVSVVPLSRTTDRGHKMGLEGTRHRALTFLIAIWGLKVSGMIKIKLFSWWESS